MLSDCVVVVSLLIQILNEDNHTTIAGGLLVFRDRQAIEFQFDDPNSIHLDSTGNLYVANYRNEVIAKITLL
jgi:hypothetical protein